MVGFDQKDKDIYADFNCHDIYTSYFLTVMAFILHIFSRKEEKKVRTDIRITI